MLLHKLCLIEFQSTPPRGGRRPQKVLLPHLRRFNPRPRAGGDPIYHARPVLLRCFNPRPRAGGDVPELATKGYNSEFQSTPPRGGRHACCGSRMFWFDVSIHAPARGATMWARVFGRRSIVSIHAPARGATGGGRRFGRGAQVSIHAPARGATMGWTDKSGTHHSFNPRPRAGGDPCPYRKFWFDYMFQSTPPRGGRRDSFPVFFHRQIVSIHAPARGATL